MMSRVPQTSLRIEEMVELCRENFSSFLFALKVDLGSFSSRFTERSSIRVNIPNNQTVEQTLVSTFNSSLR